MTGSNFWSFEAYSSNFLLILLKVIVSVEVILAISLINVINTSAISLKRIFFVLTIVRVSDPSLF